MTKVSLRLAAAAAFLGAVACSEKQLTLSEGTASTLTVRAYVDADGDGAFTASTDLAVAAITVTATRADAEESQTTDQSGVATFDLAPGSYTLAAAGTVPAGAVLATASNPVVVAPFQGAELASEFRYSYLPGELSLVVYRDDDSSGTFDAAMDTPAPGLAAVLTSGSDTVGSGMTDNDGAVGFETLRPGSYTLTLTPFPTIQITDGDTRSVAIEADVTTDLEVQFSGNLVIPVGDARNAADGSTVAVEGIITWQSFRTNLDAFMQDGSAGITLFDFGLDPTPVTEGDSVRVIGTKGSFRGEVQISPVSSVDVLANVGVPAPRFVTAAEINAGLFQSELVTLDGTLDSLQIFSFDNHNAWLTDGAGDEFFVAVDSRIGVGSADWVVDQPYTIIGVLSSDDRNAFQYRVEIRGPDDFILGGSAISLADARTMDGQVVTVEGILTWQQEYQTRLEAYIQDGTAGIALFDFGIDPTGLLRGDRLRIRGTVGSFRSEVQIGSVQGLSVLGNEPVPASRTVTAAEINAGMFQAELVTITGTVDSVKVLSFDNQDVYFTDGQGESFLAFVDARTGITPATWTDGMSYQVTGVLTFDDRNATLPARVEPRDPGDVQ